MSGSAAFALFEDLLGSTVMDVLGGEHRDPGMSMLGVVPREVGPAEAGRDGDIFEPPGEAGRVLQGLELCFGEGVVIADLGATERARHPEVGEQLCGALAGHRRAAGALMFVKWEVRR